MDIGKQSTLNDLLALKTYLEQKINEVELVGISAGSSSLAMLREGNFNNFPNEAITASLITGGDLYPDEASGSLNSIVSRYSQSGGYGAALMMEDTPVGTTIFYRQVVSGSIGSAHKLWASSNTITDANGFIKAA